MPDSTNIRAAVAISVAIAGLVAFGSSYLAAGLSISLVGRFHPISGERNASRAGTIYSAERRARLGVPADATPDPFYAGVVFTLACLLLRLLAYIRLRVQ